MELYDEIARGDLKAAQATNERMAPLTQLVYAAPPINYYSRMKAAMNIMGSLPNAVVRPPLHPVSEREVEEIRGALRAEKLEQRELVA